MNIQWYPGHMVKAKRMIQESLRLVDVVIELLDARIPFSSRNPDLKQILSGKPRIVVLNKADLADPQATDCWVQWYEQQGIKAIPVNSVSGQGISELLKAINENVSETMQKLIQRGRKPRPPRVMIVGIPNVGKSSLINRLANRASAKTGDIPGVTRNKQWIRLKGNIELLDTPGVLWPKFDDPKVGITLAITGAINDELYDQEEVAKYLAEFLITNAKEVLLNRFDLEEIPEDIYDLFKMIGEKRMIKMSGGEIDFRKVAIQFLLEFRRGRLGKISLEKPLEGEDTLGN